MALSKSRKWLAVGEQCEKAPIATIYKVEDEKNEEGENTTSTRKKNDKTLKKKKIILSQDIQQKSFVSMAFSPKNEKQLVTLTSEPDQHVHIWDV